ncbi:sulfate transporter [Holotrichia oblita]|uniref:Sulfate transporter n=1 Tax=Holotrichia oblita TaxID=644536 RepID=A0ACB9SPQ3_HOLOL|nr:sulfate transporter [Holotrichia oblita]
MLRSPLPKLTRALPILSRLSAYNSEIALADIIAGITVGLTLISQSIAYAVLADLPPQYGLYSSLCGGFVYAIFGTVAALSIAPTAILSLLTSTYISGVSFDKTSAATLLCFYSGIIQACCGLLNLGFVADFISTPVVLGITSAAAILITLTQLISIFGLPRLNNRSFVGLWKHIFLNISSIHIWDTVLGIFCCCFLIILARLQSQSLYKERDKTNSKFKRLKIFLWFLSISRNLLLIFISTALAYILSSDSRYIFSLSVNHLQPNFPSISVPPFNVIGNNTTLTFLDMTKELGMGIVVVPFIAIVTNLAIAKSFIQYNILDGSQEILALGICNIIGSCVGAMPVSGSFSRSAINHSSGVRTPVAGIYTEIDVLPLLITFFAGLFLAIEIGVLVGIAVNVLILLYYVSRPQINIQRVIIQGKEYVKVIPLGSVFYPSADYLKRRIMKNEICIDKCKEGNVIIIDCSKLMKTDFTMAKTIGALADDLQKDNKTIAFLKLTPKLSKLVSKTCRNCMFAFTDDVLFEMLKERRYSDILDSYKNIKVEPENISDTFSVVTKL